LWSSALVIPSGAKRSRESALPDLEPVQRDVSTSLDMT
jgi:hypothetical protein